MLDLLFLSILFLLWGSFLNVVGHRLLKDVSIIRPRSHCPLCKHTLAWYDLIPVISYFSLRGKCRYCKASISLLYPIIEAITALALTSLFILVPSHFIPAYLFFFSALIISIRTDLELMLISRLFTLCLIPIGVLFAATSMLPITPFDSILGAACGYGFLWLMANAFLLITGKHGMGQGDLELLAFIGSFIGVFGIWATLLLSTIIGSLIGLLYIKLARQSHTVKIPFGPFLALGAMLYVLFEPYITAFLIPG